MRRGHPFPSTSLRTGFSLRAGCWALFGPSLIIWGVSRIEVENEAGDVGGKERITENTEEKREHGGFRGLFFGDGEGDFEGADFVGSGVEDADAEEELAGGKVELLEEAEWTLDELRSEEHTSELSHLGNSYRV